VGARAGLDRARVIEAAGDLADESGAGALTLAALAARLGVRSQSLYAHVAGLDGLRRDLAIEGQYELADRLGTAVMGRAGADALRALAAAYARFAAERPGLYACALRAPLGDSELEASSEAATAPWRAALRSFGLSAAETEHYHRALWAALHGFVSLRGAGLMTRAASTDRSFATMVDAFVDALTARAAVRGPT
jgi:AcrR family transcriptional regulator